MSTRTYAPAHEARCVYAYTASETAKGRRPDPRIHQQEAEIGVWASEHGFRIAEHVAEHGFDPAQRFDQRPEGKRLLGMVRRGDVVIAAKFDRLFGAPDDAHATLAMARERGVHFRALDLGEGNQNLERNDDLATVLLAVSAAHTNYPKSLAGHRVKRRESAAGNYLGGRPKFGSTTAEQQHIAALRWQQSLGATLEKLRQFSDQAGFPLTRAGIKKILDREKAFETDQN